MFIKLLQYREEVTTREISSEIISFKAEHALLVKQNFPWSNNPKTDGSFMDLAVAIGFSKVNKVRSLFQGKEKKNDNFFW